MEKDLENINIEVSLKKDFQSSSKAIARVKTLLKKQGYANDGVKGFFYFIGPDTSDLIVVEPATKGKAYKVRICTDEEWREYFYKNVCPPLKTEEEKEAKKERKKKSVKKRLA